MQKAAPDAAPALRRSVFLLTINPNFSTEDPDTERDVRRRFNRYMDSMLRSPRLVKFVAPRENDTYNEHVKDIFAEWSIEKGTNKYGGRVHAHAVITVDHESKLLLDLAAIRGFWTRVFGHTPYVNARGTKSHEFLFGKYVRKDAQKEDDGQQK